MSLTRKCDTSWFNVRWYSKQYYFLSIWNTNICMLFDPIYVNVVKFNTSFQIEFDNSICSWKFWRGLINNFYPWSECIKSARNHYLRYYYWCCWVLMNTVLTNLITTVIQKVLDVANNGDICRTLLISKFLLFGIYETSCMFRCFVRATELSGEPYLIH